MSKIIKNRAYCIRCEEEIESKTVWDFVGCTCWKKWVEIENSEEYKGASKKEKENLETQFCKGIAVDGGKDYLKRCGYFKEMIETSIIVEDEGDSK